MKELKFDNLIGLPFSPGKQDCFELTKNFFHQNFPEVKFPDVARPTDWDADKLDLIGKVYPQIGFEKIDGWDLHPGDVLATAIGSSKPNHLVVYVGNNELIQHKFNSFSSIDPFRPAWKMYTCYVLRHPLVPYEEEILPDVDLEDLLLSQYSL
jgi:cell wall-associated NlpC family hydrolase